MSEIQIVAQPHPFQQARMIGFVPMGLTVSEIVDEVYRRADLPLHFRRGAIVQINGEIVPGHAWALIKPKPLAHVVVSTALHGGKKKNPFRTILSLAVAVAAPYLAGAIAPTISSALGILPWSFGNTIVTGLLSAGFSAIGSMAVNALVPPRPPQLANFSGGSGALSSGGAGITNSPTYSISGARNQANPYGPIPVVLGRHKATPVLGAKAYTEILGKDEYLRMLFIWGYGPLKIEDIRIGDTPISQFTDVEIETREGRVGDAAITLVPQVVLQTGIGVALAPAGDWVVRTTELNADEISIDIIFPRGLIRFNERGERVTWSVNVEIQYRLTGAMSWTPLEQISTSDVTTSPIRRGKRWTVARGQYDVRLRNITAAGSGTNNSYIEDVQWSTLRTFRVESPVNFPKPLAMTALRIKASEQLQGIIEDLNATVTSYAPDWNGSAWVEAATQNPASLARLVLTGAGNNRARTLSQIDDAAFVDFHEYCATNGYTFNMVRDYRASVWDVLSDITGVARATPNLTDGKWSVAIDKPDKPVVQFFTPRNSWGFEAEKAFYEPPHAWRARFVDETNGYQQDERIIYDDGYTVANATRFESIEFPGVTHPDQVWKLGRFHIAQARLRPETYRLSADFESLICQRGDVVRVAHDVPLWGGQWGRVKEVTDDGTYITGITLDEEALMESGNSYVCRFRLDDGTDVVIPVETVVGSSNTLTPSEEVAIEDGPVRGDLAMFGLVNLETVKLLVTGVDRGEGMTAALKLVDYAPEIYDADTGSIPAFVPNISRPVDITKLPPPTPAIVSVESGTSALEVTASLAVISRILVGVQQAPGNIPTATFRLRFRIKDTNIWSYSEAPANAGVVIANNVTDSETYEFQVQALSIYGEGSLWTDVRNEVVIGQGEVPANVSGFRVNIVDGAAHAAWEPNRDVDLSHYRLRWSPLKSGATWGSAVDMVQRVGKPATSVSMPARVGTFLIKAVDFAGNESATAAASITSIDSLRGLNFVEELVRENPDWNDTADRVEYRGDLGGLVLATPINLYDAVDLYDVDNLYSSGLVEAEGYYTMPYVDLGSVLRCKVSAEIEISGVDLASDLYELDDLYAALNLYGAADGQWDVEIQIRTTNDDPAGSPTWSEWQAFIVGDFNARAYQPRLFLRGTPPTITPIVSYFRLVIDMDDRVVSFEATIDTAGSRITYTPPFYVTPRIALATYDGAEGDGYLITGEDETGFDIAFTNGGGAVERRISGTAVGYGEQTV